ncbi:MAG: hypothetical protein IR527_00265 [Bacteroides sp.]|nr:MAG: hypothetical protein IR527_00265 [Bacteroides sp.]
MSYTRLKRKKLKNIFIKKQALDKIKLITNIYGKNNYKSYLKNNIAYKNSIIIKELTNN